mmetsp:Transcript_28261/g.86622  ORF Transcript_28261/g.86622 Transcript_28261/m.86622 type:complete len:254 (-) Transcript_28261:137-898(-)
MDDDDAYDGVVGGDDDGEEETSARSSWDRRSLCCSPSRCRRNSGCRPDPEEEDEEAAAWASRRFFFLIFWRKPRRREKANLTEPRSESERLRASMRSALEASWKLVARPEAPWRAARPTRCKWFTTLSAKSYWTTCWTCGKSRPRAAKSVQHSTVTSPRAKASKVRRRLSGTTFLWYGATGRSVFRRRNSATACAVAAVFAKTMALSLGFKTSTSRWSRSSPSTTSRNSCRSVSTGAWILRGWPSRSAMRSAS